MKSYGKIFYEVPIDAWYSYSIKDDTLTPINEKAKNSINKQLTLKEYQTYVINTYSEAESEDSMGGGGIVQHKETNSINSVVLSTCAFLFLVLLFHNRKNINPMLGG